MQARTLIIILVFAAFGLLSLALLAGQVGGIAIRSNGAQTARPEISISSPVIRGTAIMVHWTVPANETSRSIRVTFRDQAGEQTLSTTTITAASAGIVIPCAVNGTNASVLLRAADNNELIASQEITLLPPGQECAPR